MNPSPNLLRRMESRVRQADAGLRRLLPKESFYPERLGSAIRYSVFSGGKRVRPFLVFESAELFGMKAAASWPAACAVEMVHAYSLIHDDLPAMDDDDYRRGKKTCHRAFDEATAILAGDGLLSLAFEVLSGHAGLNPRRALEAVRILARASGPHGMVGGQSADLSDKRKERDARVLKQVNLLKTGALIEGALEIGAVWAGAGPKERETVRKAGRAYGFLFQLVDDILDGDGYAALWGKDKTLKLARKTAGEAAAALRNFGARAKVLIEFGEYLVERKV